VRVRIAPARDRRAQERRGDRVVTPIGGHCDPAFAAVRDAFATNFAEHGELGAAVCVMVDGRAVVDLWGGWVDPERSAEWGPDTLVDVFSIGKGIAASVVLRTVDPDTCVADVWPEFAAGKEAVTVRQILSHQAGLPAVREPLPDGAIYDQSTMAAVLAAQEPWWEPGTAHGYHVNTFGFLAAELVRRVDGRTLGTVLREDVAGPLGADVHIGLPAADHGRVATFVWPAGADPGAAYAHDEMLHRTYANPPGISGAGVVNTPAWRSAEMPSTNGHGSARGVARFYAPLAAGGGDVLPASVLAAAVEEQVHGPDRVLGRISRFGLGFQLPQEERPIGPHAGAFGHFGAGGSLGFADPEARLSFGYVMNTMGPRWQNPRNRALLAALTSSL
jgi:CubicO group peptidase (beta-lactamase class C family)